MLIKKKILLTTDTKITEVKNKYIDTPSVIKKKKRYDKNYKHN